MQDPQDLKSNPAQMEAKDAAAHSPAAPDESWARETLTQLAFATLNEQKSARRWKVGLRVAWLVLFAVVFWQGFSLNSPTNQEIGRASCRERVSLNV